MISNYFVKGILAVALATIPVSAGTIIAETVYTFTGTCTDCNNAGALGPVTGTLVLSDSGLTLSTADFISFTYSGSTLFPAYTISAGDPGLFVSGSIPSTLPSTATVDLDGDRIFFQTNGPGPSSGLWDTGHIGNESGDQGVVSQWSAAATTSTPEPTTVAMLGVALVGLVIFRRRIFSAL